MGTLNPPGDAVLPCGCFLHCDEETNELRISPCRLSCPNLEAAIGETKAQSKPVSFRAAS